MDRYDVVVIGAGAFGLGSAYHLARRGAGRIALIDSLAGPGQGNTGRSVGGYRKGIFTSELNRMLSESTVSFLSDLQRSGVDLGMHNVGYLVLLNGDQLETHEAAIREMVRKGNARLLSSDDLGSLVPWMRLDFRGDEEAEMLGLKNVEAALLSDQSGYLDVEKLVNYLHEEIADAGVELRFGERVRRLRLGPVVSIGHPREPLVWQEKRIDIIESDRSEVRADLVVLATGAWINELLDPLGLDSHVKPKKRQVFSIDAKGELRKFFEVDGLNEYSTLPMTFFPRGPYLTPRVRERALWTGLSDDVGRSWGIDFAPEETFYYDNIYPSLSKVFPVLKDVRPTSSWAGCYSINTIDENPIAFRWSNLIVVTGGSGSGVMKYDAMSRVVASLAFGEEEAVLYTGERLPVSWLGIKNRRAEPESFVF